MDPKVERSGVRVHDLRAQEELALAVRGILDESKILAYNVKDANQDQCFILKMH